MLDNGENPEEEKKYCICDRISFGEMIGCDYNFVFNKLIIQNFYLFTLLFISAIKDNGFIMNV